jgi:Holliday junction resolvase RusA-like endonuclease
MKNDKSLQKLPPNNSEGGDMGKLAYSRLIENFQVVPAPRMTRQGRFSKRAQQYLKNKKDLAWQLKQGLSLAKPFDFPVIISLQVCLPRDSGQDFDNILKTVLDALRFAGIISDDTIKHVPGGDIRAMVRKGEAWVKIELRKLKNWSAT